VFKLESRNHRIGGSRRDNRW